MCVVTLKKANISIEGRYFELPGNINFFNEKITDFFVLGIWVK